MSNEIIEVLMVEPGKHPKSTFLAVTMRSFRNAVSIGADEVGDVESKKIGKGVYIIYNCARCFGGLAPNRRVKDDIIAGTFYVVAVDEKNYPISLTEKQVKRYMSMFWEIEAITDEEVVEANLEYLLGYIEEFEES